MEGRDGLNIRDMLHIAKDDTIYPNCGWQWLNDANTSLSQIDESSHWETDARGYLPGKIIQ